MRTVSLLFAISIVVMVVASPCFGQCSTRQDTEGGSYENSDGEVRCSSFAPNITKLIPELLPDFQSPDTQQWVLITDLLNPIIHDIWDPIPEQQILGRRKLIENLTMEKDMMLRRRA